MDTQTKERAMADVDLPPHVEETVRVVEKLHVEHRQEASFADRLLDRAKAIISRPVFLALVFGLVLTWMLVNLALPLHIRPDPAPFLYLSLCVSVGALCLTVLILATQWRADRLADHREKLILQLSFVSEQKTAKLIALLEELRRDLPQVRDRLDAEAQEMTAATNVSAVSEALRDDSPAEIIPRSATESQG